MRKLFVVLTVITSLFSVVSAAQANYVGTEISLNGIYDKSFGVSSDGSAYELWLVLSNAGFASLGADVQLDASGGTPSSYYHVYKDFFLRDNNYYNRLIAEVAGSAALTSFGWYEQGHAGDVGDITKTTWGQLFSGSDTVGAGAGFVNSNYIGYWINPRNAGAYFYTDSASNGGDMQALLFDLSGYTGIANDYMVCFEDRAFTGDPKNDFDYQDLIVRSSRVPEPATLALFGIGSAAMALIRKKKKTA